nr:breast cancer type 2 susceptibility protein homolog isoform X2 [Crassostrea gigas]
MEAGKNNKTLCQKCGEIHQTLRLSLRKRAKKCFSRSKKKLQEAVGPSSEDWFQVATTQKLQAKQREKEERSLFMSPVSQCSSQLTPDILKFHRGRTYESSPEISTFERLLSSQSSTSSPHSRWLHPSLGSSPQDGGRDQNLASEEAIIRSLGISADDSGISWTSSLATPSHPLSPTDSGVKQDVNEDQLSEKRKQKRVPRALFSPGVVRNPDELCHSLNKSDIEIKVEPDEDAVKEGASKEVHVLDISVKSEVETDSMQLFSQELITEETSLENDVVYLGEKSPSTKKDNCASADETMASAIKQEVIDETLSDFFDPPSKSVGRRRCAPSKGRKRKSLGDSPLGLDFPFKREAKAVVSLSPSLSPAASTRRVLKAAKEKFNTPVERNKPPRSILSNEKCRGSRSGTRKRVTFSNSDDFFKEIKAGKEEGGKSNKQLKKTEDVDINVPAETVESLKSRDFDSCDQTKVPSVDVTVEDSEDLFSQVSPSSLNEMCSIDNEDLFAKDVNSSSSKKNDDHGKILNSFDAAESMATNGNSQNKAVNNETQKQHSSDDVASMADIATVVPKISGLRSKGRKFLYPTTNQITKSCPKVVYGFKEVESPFHNQHITSESPTVEKNDGEPTAGQGIENKSRETKSPKVSSTTGFQRFSKLEPADNQREKTFKEELTSKPDTKMSKMVNRSIDIKVQETKPELPLKNDRKLDILSTDRKLDILSTDRKEDILSTDKKQNDRSAISNANKLVTSSPLNNKGQTPQHIKEESEVQPSTSMCGSSTKTFGGFSTAGGRKFVMDKDALQKARSLLEKDDDNDLDNGVQKLFEQGEKSEENVDHRLDPISLPSTGSKECTGGVKVDDILGSDGCSFKGFQTARGKKVECSESSLKKAQRMIIEGIATEEMASKECTVGSKVDWTSSSSAGFQGFQTASGKKVECSDSSLEKAQRMITEEGDTKSISNTESEWDDIETVMPSGDKISAVKGQEIGFSSVKEFINPGLKSSKSTAQSSGSKSADFQTKGKNIFSDIFEEFQDCGSNIDADSIPGFKTSGGKGFNSASSCLKNIIPTNNKKGSKEPNEESVDSVVEEDIIKSMFSGIKGKVGNNSNTKPVGPSTFTRPVNTAQQMKSASIAARFPPGSNIPKGFRPFKPPKIAPKAKPHIPTASDVVSKTTVDKSESVQEIQPHSNEGSRDEEKNVNENFCNKENDKMDDSADLSNLFLNDMFEEEMEISQKLTPEPVANSGKVMKKISEEYIERVKESACSTSIPEKAEETTEKSLNGGPSAKMPVEMVDVLQQKFDGFQTASGKAVSIDEESLKKAKELWDNQTTGNDDKETDPEVTFQDINTSPFLRNNELMKQRESPSPTEKSFNVSLVPDPHAQRPHSNENIAGELKTFQGFQTASGKSVNIDEQSLLAAKELWKNSIDDSSLKPLCDENVNKNPKTFCTNSVQNDNNVDRTIRKVNSSFKKCSNSEKEDNVHVSHVEEKMKEKPAQLGGFQTASGKHVTVSEKAILDGKKLWDNFSMEDGHPSTNSLQSTRDDWQLPENEKKKEKVPFCGFQTASVKTVKVDDKSLTEARKLWSSSGVEERETQTHTVLENLCQPDNFSQNNVKEKNEMDNAYEEKTLQDSEEKPKNQIVPHLSSSSDMKLDVSSLSTMGEKKMVNDINIQSGCPLDFQSPFMSASGKKIQVSEEALNHVKLETLKTEEGKENEKPVFQNDETKPVMNSSESMSCPFLSASGKQISVSASALESTKSFFDDNEKDVSSLTTDSKKFSPFHSASGKSVSVSKKSLEIARAILEEDHEMKTLRTAAATGLPNETHSKEKSFSPFESASGRKVSVSQKSLEMARAKLEDNEGPEKQTSTPKISKVHYIEGDISPFQSASGKSVSVSKKYLEKARARLMENFEADVDTLPTSSADTPSTSSRQETGVVFPAHSQKRKLDEIKTPKKQKTREVEDANEYENLILPDDFFDEMETPNKKIKMENGTASKTLPGHVGKDRQNFTALSTVPEGYTKDRQNFYANPLKCQSARDSGSSYRALVYQEETKKQNTPSAATASGSSFRTPYKAGSTFTESQGQSSSVVKSVQPVFVPKSKQQAHSASPLDVKSASKTVSKNLGPAVSSSLSTSPQTGNSKQDMTQKTTKSDKEKEEYKKALETARGKQEEMMKSKSSCSVKPSAGRLFQLKTSGTRCKLREVIFGQQQNMTDSSCVISSTLLVRSCNAARHRFYLPDFYSADVTQVYVGDGALLVPDDQGYTGVKELYKAFLTIDSVDPSLISEAWFCNHYRWIVWKLASYEVASPDKFGSRALTPENVMLQMKYRYDREIDRCQRSALRKIMERDDTSSKRLVLCVSSVQRVESTNPATPSSKQTVLDPEVTVELTDGWYCIPAKLDVPLLDLINRRRIQTGHKLCTTGAELVGSQDPCTPLEAPSSLQLKINANSTRPVPWDTVLGFQPDPRPLCVPLSDLHGEGGMVGCVDVVLGRKYPLMYMEKLPDGGSVFRTAQAEEKFSQLHQKQQQEAMESLYRKLEKDFDKEDYEESRAVKRQWKESEIEELQSGQEVWEALRTAKRPDIVEGYLSDSQMRLLMDYKQQLHQEKLQRLQNEFQKSWSDEQGARNVVPLLKLRVMGLSKKDVDSRISTVISVWRPGQEVLDLKEGQRYRVFSLSASHSRARYSPNSVQLTANRQTKFLPVRVDENLLDLVYEPREVLCACDLKRRQPMFGEVDIVCLIVDIEVTEAGESSRNQEIVYGMDKNGDILGIKFWGGLKAFGLNATLTVGTVVCGSNLQDKFPQRSTILPLVEASMEFSVFTKTPQGAPQKKAHQVLTERIKTAGEKTLVERGQQLVAELLEKKRKMTLGHTPTKTVCSEQGEENASPVPPSSAQKAKIAQLMSYGSPSPSPPSPPK